jgi:diguanylate cyclase (GGDEF)-like protein
MLQTMSDWLAPDVDHASIGLLHSSQENRMVLVPPGMAKIPEVETLAREIAGQQPARSSGSIWSSSGLGALFRPIALGNGMDRFLLIRHGVLSEREESVLAYLLSEALGSLRRGLDYDQLYEQARIDPLTGLLNRRAFDESLLQVAQSCARHTRTALLINIDLDNFKQINDRLGHQTGDRVLRDVARALRGLVRVSDLVARTGGDEFVILLPDTDHRHALTIVRRVKEAVSTITEPFRHTAALGISAGAAEWRAGSTPDKWLKRADRAMYQAKANKLGRCR